jgi:deoxycytidylate deaminase
MNPIPRGIDCEHPWVQVMVKSKGEYVTRYPCLVCGTVIIVAEQTI